MEEEERTWRGGEEKEDDDDEEEEEEEEESCRSSGAQWMLDSLLLGTRTLFVGTVALRITSIHLQPRIKR